MISIMNILVATTLWMMMNWTPVNHFPAADYCYFAGSDMEWLEAMHWAMLMWKWSSLILQQVNGLHFWLDVFMIIVHWLICCLMLSYCRILMGSFHDLSCHLDSIPWFYMLWFGLVLFIPDRQGLLQCKLLHIILQQIGSKLVNGLHYKTWFSIGSYLVYACAFLHWTVACGDLLAFSISACHVVVQDGSLLNILHCRIWHIVAKPSWQVWCMTWSESLIWNC